MSLMPLLMYVVSFLLSGVIWFVVDNASDAVVDSRREKWTRAVLLTLCSLIPAVCGAAAVYVRLTLMPQTPVKGKEGLFIALYSLAMLGTTVMCLWFVAIGMFPRRLTDAEVEAILRPPPSTRDQGGHGGMG